MGLVDAQTLKVTLEFLPLLKLCEDCHFLHGVHGDNQSSIAGSWVPPFSMHSTLLPFPRPCLTQEALVVQNSQAMPDPLGLCPSGKILPFRVS